MKAILMVAALALATTTVGAPAQAPQNPEACAQLGKQLGDFLYNMATRGGSPLTEEEIRATIEIDRMTGHPCYLPPGTPQNPACVQLRKRLGEYAYNMGTRGGRALTQRELLQFVENQRLLGDPCFAARR